MFCRLILLAIAALTIVDAFPKTDETIDVIVVNAISEIAKKYPGAIYQPLNKEVGESGDKTVRYTLGRRVTGDQLVGKASDVYTFPEKKNFSLELKYGYDGNGAIISYIDIACQQEGDGKAYVVAGGIGKRFIAVVIEAYQTQNFAFTAQYYGY